MSVTFKEILAKVATGATLSQTEATRTFETLFTGEATPSQIGALLMGLRVRGETVDEIIGAVITMRSKMIWVKAPDDAVDVVGTGGDASGSYNISTLAAFIVAGAGVPVAKHGNRALSSKSGAADCLQALGVKIDLTPEQVSRCIYEAGIGFMFAPAHHPAMKNVAATRTELGTRTIFNLLGPLSNPAGVTKQLIGVFSPVWLKPVAEVLQQLGSTNVYVVHGQGLDEITGTGETKVCSVEDGVIREFSLSPSDFGFKTCSMQDLKGGDGVENAAALLAVLNGATNAYHDVAVMNAAATLRLCGKAANFAEATSMALHAVKSGAAKARLAKLIEISND